MKILDRQITLLADWLPKPPPVPDAARDTCYELLAEYAEPREADDLLAEIIQRLLSISNRVNDDGIPVVVLRNCANCAALPVTTHPWPSA